MAMALIWGGSKAGTENQKNLEKRKVGMERALTPNSAEATTEGESLLLFFFETEFHCCHPGWSTVAQS